MKTCFFVFLAGGNVLVNNRSFPEDIFKTQRNQNSNTASHIKGLLKADSRW